MRSLLVCLRALDETFLTLTPMHGDAQWLLELLRQTTTALAQPAEAQLQSLPDFVCKSDELALDFAASWQTARDCLELTFSSTQRRALNELDEALALMSGPENAELWTDEALKVSPEWDRVRSLATAALQSIGMPGPVP